MRRHLGILSAATLAFWAVLLGVAWLLWDHLAAAVGLSWGATVAYSLVAVVLCLLPCAATLLWVAQSGNQTPEQQLTAVLGGTGVRMFFVLGVGMLLNNLVPYFQHAALWIGILIFYLFTLALEIVILVRARSAVEAQTKPPGETRRLV